MFRHTVGMLLVVSLAFLASGCAVLMLGEGHEGGSGSLSDAAALARSDSTTRYKVPTPDVGYTTPPVRAQWTPSEPEPALAPGIAPASEPGAASPAGPARVHAEPLKRPFLAGVVLGGGSLGSGGFDHYGTGGISVGGYPMSRLRIDAAATLEGVSFTPNGTLDRSFKAPAEVNLDVTMRYYVTSDHTFLGIYPLLGVGTGTLLWDYTHPVTVTEDGKAKVLKDDRLNYFSFFVGAGMSLIQTRYVHVGGNMNTGVRFYGWTTNGGLDNNMFKTSGFVRMLLEMSFRVAKV